MKFSLPQAIQAGLLSVDKYAIEWLWKKMVRGGLKNIFFKIPLYRVSHIIGPTLFFLISRVLEHLQRNFLPFFNSPGNLLHFSHKNFEN